MNVRLASIAALVLALPASAQDPGPYWVHGRVDFPAGFPPGERVEVLARRGLPQSLLTGALLGAAPLDADGGFELELDLHDPGFFLVLHSRWLDLRPLWIEALPGEHGIEITLVPALLGILHGRFVAPADAPFAAHAIGGSWAWIEGPGAHASEVDSNGEFELSGNAAAASGCLCARPRDFAPVQVDAPRFVDGAESELLLPLVEPATLRGRVVGSSGQGLAGVTLSIWRGIGEARPLRLDPWGDVQAVTSAEDGSFEAADLPPGELTLRIEDPRWRALGLPVHALQPGELREGLEFALERAASLRGIVVDERANPVAGARVTAGMRDGSGVVLVTTTDLFGRYAFDAAPPGEFVLGASLDGEAAGARTLVALAEGAHARQNLVLGRGSTLRIALSDLAPPVHVRVVDALGFLHADQRVWQGELDLTLPPGLYRVLVEGRGGLRSVRRIVLTGRERAAVTLWP